MPERPPLVPVVVGVVLLTAAVATATQFPWVRSQLSAQYRALSHYPSTSPADVIDNHWESMQHEYGLYTDLHEYAAGAAMTLPHDLRISTEQLYGLSRLREVRRTSQPSVSVEDVPEDLDDHVVASGEHRSVGPYTIALSSKPDELVVFESADGVFVIDRALLPETGDGDG